MYCCDSQHLEAVFLGKAKMKHVPDLGCEEASKLSRLIGLLKRGFRGNARILLILSGGHIDDMKVNEASFDEERVKAVE